MIKNITLFIIISTTFFISSCSNLILFTQEIRDDLNENNLEIEKVQFYNSKKIILKRSLSKEETQIAKGVIRFENGQYFEEIIIPKKTKGIAVCKGSKYLRIAFELGENKNLRFSLNGDSEYQIAADTWKNDFGCINYDTTKYYIIPGSNNTLLLVDKEHISNYEKKRRVVKGRSVGR